MKATLIVIGGKKDGMEIPISTPQFLIGRGSECHFQPESALVGQIHCMVLIEKDSVAIEDCGGAIGTLVNGQKVHLRHPLNSGDRIKIATLEFEVRLTADEGDEKKRKTDHVWDVMPVRSAALQDAYAGRASSPTMPSSQSKEVREPAPRKAEVERVRVEIEWDRADLLMMAATGMLLVAVLSYLFPMESWPSWSSLWRKSMFCLNNLWYYAWLRWGIVGILVVALAAALRIHARKHQ